ncbi:MAG: dockerin type I domain-containing protein [Bacteroidales bacterium]|nr:dockerin type I domain-containing protein [Bacteroidales bacterium]
MKEFKFLRILALMAGLFLFAKTGYTQYLVNFEGAGETKTAYASGTVILSGLDWNMTEALIGTDAADFKNGLRSARMRGHGATSITMLQNKANGIGVVSFQYRRYGTDAQVDWKVEYSINDGASWTQIGADFKAPAIDDVQNFWETINVEGNIRLRIKRATETGTANRRLNIDDITITDYSSGSTPTISVSPSTLSGFSYIVGAGPSATQSFTCSGANLTNNISIAATTNYEISLSPGSGYTTPLTLTHSGGIVASTTIYVRLKAGLSAGNYNNEDINITSTGATNKTVTCNGSVVAGNEPTNHVTSFTATANSSTAITVNWTDSDASGYLVKGSAASYAAITVPVDGTAESDGALVKNVASGVGSHQFTGLTASTPYYFKIFPYNGSGTLINYKTDGTVPQATATTQAGTQNYLIDFDDASKWTASSGNLSSYYSDHTYIDGAFLSTGGPALRNGIAAQDGFPGALGTYSWRQQNLSTVDWRITISSGGVSTFSMKIRRWDGDPSPDFNLEYSTDGGTIWTLVSVINNNSLDNSSNWKTFNGIINSGNNNILIRLKANAATERIMVDDFSWEAYSGGQPVVATPTFSPAAGTYSSQINVSITSTTPEATIYFNTNSASGPWATYASPIPVSVNTTVWAYAAKTDMTDSQVASAVYNFVATCPEPTSLYADNLTYNSATLHWTAGGSEAIWNIEYGLAGFTQGMGTLVSNVTTNSKNLTGLTPESSYNYYVRSVCSESLTSSWAGPGSFLTLIAPPSPYAVVLLRPQQIDLSSDNSQSAVLMQVGNYTSDDARYRLYNGSNQYYCWDGSQFVTSTVYAAGPQVPGAPSNSSTFWILFTRGNNNTATASYRDRLDPYSVNYQTVALPGATVMENPFDINLSIPFTGNYSLDEKYVILGFDAELGGNLVSATSSGLNTGDFTLNASQGTTIRRIEVRTQLNELIDQLSGTWPPVCQDVSISNFPTSIADVCEGALFAFDFSSVNIQHDASTLWQVSPPNAGHFTGNLFHLNQAFTGGLVTISLTAYATPPCQDASAQVSFMVNPLPIFTCPTYGPLCVGDQAIVFSGPGITTQNEIPLVGFNPTTPGTFNFTYTVTENGCSSYCEFEVVVYPFIVPTCPENIEVYITVQPFALSGGLPPGGVYSGNGVNGDIFYPAVAGLGTHWIIYAYNNGFCGQTTCQFSITVTEEPITCQHASISNFPTSITDACEGSLFTIDFSTVNIQHAASTLWQVNPPNAGNITDNLFSLNQAFTGGLVTISLAAYATPPCQDAYAQASFTVNSLPIFTCPVYGPYIAGDPLVVFTEPGVFILNGLVVTSFNPQTAGVYTFTYTKTVSGCSSDCQFDIVVNPPVGLRGDANGDGLVNVLDVITVINYIMGQNPPGFIFLNADVNGDQEINVLDVIGIINIIMAGK